tara:strand:+ start:98 stop:385 length:288 start_codon:yes stop_codon:yes gene_type:complete
MLTLNIRVIYCIYSNKLKRKEMKSYQMFIDRPAPTPAHISYTKKLVAKPDPKREGMYKITEYHSCDNYKSAYPNLYGKKNQAEINRLIKEEMEEI